MLGSRVQVIGAQSSVLFARSLLLSPLPAGDGGTVGTNEKQSHRIDELGSRHGRHSLGRDNADASGTRISKRAEPRLLGSSGHRSGVSGGLARSGFGRAPRSTRRTSGARASGYQGSFRARDRVAACDSRAHARPIGRPVGSDLGAGRRDCLPRTGNAAGSRRPTDDPRHALHEREWGHHRPVPIGRYALRPIHRRCRRRCARWRLGQNSRALHRGGDPRPPGGGPEPQHVLSGAVRIIGADESRTALALLGPDAGASASGPPLFRWTFVPGAAGYEVALTPQGPKAPGISGAAMPPSLRPRQPSGPPWKRDPITGPFVRFFPATSWARQPPHALCSWVAQRLNFDCRLRPLGPSPTRSGSPGRAVLMGPSTGWNSPVRANRSSMRSRANPVPPASPGFRRKPWTSPLQLLVPTVGPWDRPSMERRLDLGARGTWNLRFSLPRAPSL